MEGGVAERLEANGSRERDGRAERIWERRELGQSAGGSTLMMGDGIIKRGEEERSEDEQMGKCKKTTKHKRKKKVRAGGCDGVCVEMDKGLASQTADLGR